MSASLRRRIVSWEGLLVLFLFVVLAYNVDTNDRYFDITNQVNLFTLGIEKSIVILVMAFVIMTGEIDLSVASMMGLAAAVVAALFEAGVPMELAIVIALAVGLGFGILNGILVAVVGIPSLAVTLAGYIGFRGLARLLVEDRSVGSFPDWFAGIGQDGLLGPITLPMLIYGVLAIVAVVLMHLTGFGRSTIVIGNSVAVARFSGVRVARIKVMIFAASGLIAALAGVLIAARLGAVRASTAEGFELDIITVVLLGGVSIFGGSGTMIGVLLSSILVLNLRNGLVIAGITGNTQTGVIGLLLILSVLVPNIVAAVRERQRRRATEAAAPPAAAPPTPAG